MNPPPLATREAVREQRFNTVWTRELDRVFADVAPYYDRANHVASLGLWNWLLRGFLGTIALRPGLRVLDVCAGTNAVGIGLLEREPGLTVRAIDRSAEMQNVGRRRAEAKDMHIESTIGDVHELPFPDNQFDIVTLQWASRHLRVRRVFSEIHRVLKPGGWFYHCDMLRPASRSVETVYHAYLRCCLAFTGFLFRSGPVALNCKKYFVEAVGMFYSADELSTVLRELGYVDVGARTHLAGMIGYHRAAKPVNPLQ
jgi:demethylmenaquinone methyltransferase/2-methoxy-6-polyprenyl-1,4-benzoquinol methylase